MDKSKLKDMLFYELLSHINDALEELYGRELEADLCDGGLKAVRSLKQMFDDYVKLNDVKDI